LSFIFLAANSPALLPVIPIVPYPSTLTPTVSLGSGDSDIYSIDQNTGRTKGYQFAVGSTPKYVTGTLGWNANGTLGSLGITDAFNSLDTQNCSYTYDDIARLASVDCGASTWQQSFSYDVFGNVKKNVPAGGTGISWLPNYNGNNQYLGGGTSYDNDGNLTADTFNTYTWDSDGDATGVNAITLTYDAFDRVVEENNAGAIKEILYSPIGKLAIMNQQSASNIFISLPGGEQATYTGSTIRFRHSDWLGSARFESNMSQKEYGDVAYAPFGEPYVIKDTPYLAFTGQNQDTVSGTYDFLYREYNPTQGRWISPDPVGSSAVDPSSPQSWNRYTYVVNNPLRGIDPLGQECVWDDGSFDSEHDSSSGGVTQCGDLGGTWVELGQDGNWSSQPDEWNQTLVASIQAGNVSEVDIRGLDGLTYSTFYSQAGQTTETITPGAGPANTDISTLDARANALAVAINNTGVQVITKPQFWGCATVASAAIGGLGVEGGLTGAAETIIPALPESAGVGVKILANGGKQLIAKGINVAAAACGLASVVH
jgi:RHS repeat-associated protein